MVRRKLVDIGLTVAIVVGVPVLAVAVVVASALALLWGVNG